MKPAPTRIILQALSAGLLLASLAPASFGQATQNPVLSQNATITYGQAFTPTYSGGSGNGAWQFCIGGQTNFNPGVGEPAGTELANGQWETAWTAPSAGSYNFYIAHCANGTYSTAMAGWYSLTVNKANQPSVSSQNATISYSNGGYPPFTPSYFGGAGTGGWQFTIGGYTNWSPGPGEPSGTELSNGQWVSSWTPPGPGTLWQAGSRTDVTGAAHGGIPTPHVHEPDGSVRPANPQEIPAP